MTTRYKIAEQVLRIVNGGNNGAWLTQKTLVLKTNTDNLCYAEIAELDPTTNKHGLSNYISLPNDMGIHRVASSGHSHTREIKVVKVGGKIHKTNYQRDTIDIIFNNGPKVLDKNYIVSFDFTIGTTLMSNGSSTQNQYAGVKTHNISFNVDTSGYDSYENKHFNFIKALVNSPGFKKFIKDFDIKYGVTENDTNDNAIVDTVASILHVIQVRLSTSYGSEISDFKINGVGKNSIFGGPGVEYWLGYL